MVKFNVVTLILCFGLNSHATSISRWQCQGMFSDGAVLKQPISFVYERLEGLSETTNEIEVVQQVILAEEIFVEPMQLCIDTTGWDLDRILNFKTDLITDHPGLQCGTPDGQNSRVSFSTKPHGTELDLKMKMSGGDGLGDASSLQGRCTEMVDQ